MHWDLIFFLSWHYRAVRYRVFCKWCSSNQIPIWKKLILLFTSHHMKSKIKLPEDNIGEYLCAFEWVSEWVSEHCSVVSNSLWPYGLHSPWNSPGRILEWVAFPFSRGFSKPRDWTQVSHIAGGFLTSWTTREALVLWGRQILLNRTWH